MELERGSFEWAFATIASSLAEGTPSRVVSKSELEDAAGAFTQTFREAGHECVLLTSGVWDLSSLAEGEELTFSREAVASLFDRNGLRVVWAAP
jgi:hypothetical protein